MNNSSGDTLCKVLFEHRIYYCENCEWHSLYSFSLIQLVISIIGFLLNISAMLIVIYRFYSVNRTVRESLYEAGLFYWFGTSGAATLMALAGICDSYSLAAFLGPSKIGDMLSHVFSEISVNIAFTLEAFCASKFIISAWKMTFFKSRYPSLAFVISVWLVFLFTGILTTVIAYLKNIWYTIWIKLVQVVMEWIVLVITCAVIIYMVFYCTKIISQFCKRGNIVFMTEKAQRRFRMTKLRNWFHAAGVATVTATFFILNVIYIYYHYYQGSISNEACMAWLVPYQLLLTIYAWMKGITVLWAYGIG